jgi:hypothetical protein
MSKHFAYKYVTSQDILQHLIPTHGRVANTLSRKFNSVTASKRLQAELAKRQLLLFILETQFCATKTASKHEMSKIWQM